MANLLLVILFLFLMIVKYRLNTKPENVLFPISLNKVLKK